MSIISTVKFGIRSVRTWAKINEPTIKLVGGIVSGIGCVATACIATTNIGDILDTHTRNLEILETANDDPSAVLPKYREQYSPDKYLANKTAIYIRTGWSIAKLYAVPFSLGVLSIALTVSGHSELITRNAALSSALASVTDAYDHYRENVCKVYGKEIDDKLCQILDESEVPVVDGNGNATGKTETKYSPTGSYYNQIYMFEFGPETSRDWTTSPLMNLNFLKCQQDYAQRKLNSQGYLFLSDVLKSIGIQETKPSRCCGWIYGDTVDFGYEDDIAFMSPNDPDSTAQLNFNVRGNILDSFEDASI